MVQGEGWYTVGWGVLQAGVVLILCGGVGGLARRSVEVGVGAKCVASLWVGVGEVWGVAVGEAHRAGVVRVEAAVGWGFWVRVSGAANLRVAGRVGGSVSILGVVGGVA